MDPPIKLYSYQEFLNGQLSFNSRLKFPILDVVMRVMLPSTEDICISRLTLMRDPCVDQLVCGATIITPCPRFRKNRTRKRHR